MKSVRPMRRAWILTWEWSGDHAAVDDPIVTVVSWRWSAERVRDFVEQLYAISKYNWAERFNIARSARRNPYRAEFGKHGNATYSERISCGHNPWLSARMVADVQVVRETDGSETLAWSEIPRPSLPDQ
jgi:hypothetical protein